MKKRWRILAGACAALVCGGISRAGADEIAASAPSSSPSPLRIAVTAVQGKAEVKLAPAAPWQTARAGMELPVGSQIRTGIPGTVQLTVGDDQVCRVDRLSLVQLVRADEADGKIKTVIGMTYGRVSKDVDAPVAPHDDTIVSPTSTLAVRGTRVSLYDQPPYAPEAVSLTGAAVYETFHNPPVKLGAHGQGTAKVAGDAKGAAEYQMQSDVVDPTGEFSGRTAAEESTLQYLVGTAAVEIPPGNVIRGPARGFAIATTPLVLGGELVFPLSWAGTAQSNVDFSVQSLRNGQIVSQAAGSQNSASGGAYVTAAGFGIEANGAGVGKEEIDWGNLAGGTFPTGTYQITETLIGAENKTLAMDPGVVVNTELGPAKQTVNGVLKTVPLVNATLNIATPSITYIVSVPVNHASKLTIKP